MKLSLGGNENLSCTFCGRILISPRRTFISLYGKCFERISNVLNICVYSFRIADYRIVSVRRVYIIDFSFIPKRNEHVRVLSRKHTCDEIYIFCDDKLFDYTANIILFTAKTHTERSFYSKHFNPVNWLSLYPSTFKSESCL